jgi:hypothetical protein
MSDMIDGHERCPHDGCERISGHSGCHTSEPSEVTRAFDLDRGPGQDRRIDEAVSLLMLDFPTPREADLFDDWKDLPPV